MLFTYSAERGAPPLRSWCEGCPSRSTSSKFCRAPVLRGRGLEAHGPKPELAKRLQDDAATFRPAAADKCTEQRPAEKRRILPQRKAKKRARIARDENSDENPDGNSDGDSDGGSDHDSAVGAVGDSDADLSDNEVWMSSRLSTLGFE